MIYCQECDHIIDSDNDPACFIEKDNKVICERCRELIEIEVTNDSK